MMFMCVCVYVYIIEELNYWKLRRTCATIDNGVTELFKFSLWPDTVIV